LQTAEHPRRDRTLLDPFECLGCSHYVVEHLAHFQRKVCALLEVGCEDILERGESPLEGAGALRLATDRRLTHESGLWNIPRRLVESCEVRFGSSDSRPGRRRELNGLGKRMW